MFKNAKCFTMLPALLLLLATQPAVLAETWRLQEGRDWKALSDQSQDKYLLAVAEIKKQVDMGQTEEVHKALNKLKTDFPEIAGRDLDAFIKAETLFSKGKFRKAAKAYDKFLARFPKSRLYEAALARQFSIATAYLAGQKRPVLKVFRIKGYAEGAKIMDRISDRAGDAPIAIKSATATAESLERRGKFSDAYQEWSQISSRWPTGQTGMDALLAMARCKHAAYRGPKYDVSNLTSAKSYYENFRLRYPEKAKEIHVDQKLLQLDEQLAYKQFSIGQYYQKTGNKDSANMYYQTVVSNWPQSQAAKMANATMSEKTSDQKKETGWKTKTIKKLEKLFL